MAVSKQDLIGFLTAEQTKQVEELEGQIDERLREEYTPGAVVLVNFHSNPPHDRVRLEVERRYREQGWDATFYTYGFQIALR